ncbi:MAG: S8 family peptidase [Candidatus Zixiibacteriota bacterium]|nr:MAG: S8 family peptidase [candidate division Zixibacteria bacterium]
MARPPIIMSLLCITALIAVSSYAGHIHSGLADKLVGVNQSELIAILITVAGEIPADQLESELDAISKSLSERHTRGMLRLQSIAAATQGDLLTTLEDLKKWGLASNIESYWISNAITVNLAASEIRKLAARDDVVEIRLSPEYVPIEPAFIDPGLFNPEKSSGVESNLVVIGADSAWKLGYTGKGRTVCNFDASGINFYHPALYNNWKGHDGKRAAAWHDPNGNHEFPYAYSYHGTHTTGIMVGHDDSTGDTIGVAPDARWIFSASWNLISAFQWAADPDGIPNTTDDVPDVISNSWGLIGPCKDDYWEIIDIVEALGIVCVFSAGNEGGDTLTIRSPADRARDSLDCFAVGATDHSTGLITHFSSRGPSGCDSVSTKPNVVAPGGAIRSSVPAFFDSSLYRHIGGTSMSAPHVAGAVAILRQAVPDATPAEIKEALLAGCIPRGDPSPNNIYGWGEIYLPASLEFLSDRFRPDLHISSFEYETVPNGDTVRAQIGITNRSHPADSVYARFGSSTPGTTILTDSLFFGPLEYGDTVFSDMPLEVVFNDTIFPGTVVKIDLTLFDSGEYAKDFTIHILAGLAPEKMFYTHKSDLLHFTVSNFGQYGFANNSIRPLGYSGFAYWDTTWNSLYEAALLVGFNAGHISDGARNSESEPDDDFRVGIGGEITESAPGNFADQETYSLFDDAYAENQIGVEVRQRTLSWDQAPDNNYVIMEYDIKNISSDIIFDMYVGLLSDWNLGFHYDFRCETNFSRPENLGFIFYHDWRKYDSLHYRGISVINHEGTASYRSVAQSIDFDTGLSESFKFAALSEGLVDSNLQAGYRENLIQFISTGPFTLLPGESDTAIFAILGAEYLNELRASAIRARNKYYIATGLDDETGDFVATRFALAQNYPNPFNPSTIITYSLPSRSPVILSIYNLLGQKIRTLVDEIKSAGTHRVFWDGAGTDGQAVATGIYFYRIQAGEYVESRKMLLLK